MLVSGAWAARQRAGIAADAAALAAADVAVGLIDGEPCSRAELVARANGAALADCAIAGPVAWVTAVVPYAGWQAEVRARAGPPGTP
jgi:secretion/DNA translocation related TadE-like protein